MKYLITSFLLIFSLVINAQNSNAQSEFLVKPYLQLGKKASAISMQLLWHGPVSNDVWLAEYKNNGEADWRKSEDQTFSTIAVPNIPPFKVFSTTFNALQPGSSFQYRVSKNGKVVFNSEGKSLKSPEQSYRIAISGDMGAGSNTAKRIAYEIYKTKPDMVAIAGDIVYNRGLISEYTTKFWPVYNKDDMDTLGAPLMRSIPFVAAVGNHDASTRDLDRFPDALAYYHFWDQPLNGPVGKEGGALLPVLVGSDANKRAFYDGAGDKYPHMTNFSFDHGNAHWTIIDSNPYVDWSDSTLRDWLAKDLAGAANATWRFVLYHHPCFNSSRAHYEQQQMRLIAPILEKGKVDIVFAGHVHNYQRTYPLTFKPDNLGSQLVAGASNIRIGKTVNGRWTLDKSFNGKRNTKPNGVIYITTGAGGQGLYNPEQTKDKDSWQKFTVKFESRVHSFTIMDVSGNELVLRQVDINGKEVDRVKITK
ncbi:MAG TPA: metallophosphoesterase [Chitinophagaceae bacterium]|nr:metallophosphoesterase [Chitinophagaceae bacterium]